MSSTDQFTESPKLTAIAIGYRNPDQVLIADDVLPRITAPARNFKWTVYGEADAFTVPNTRVGRRGTPNRIEIEGTELDGSVDDFGLDIPLDNVTIGEGLKNGNDPKNKATERATDLVMLDREVRVSELVTDPSNYHGDHLESLSGTDLFDDHDSDPTTIIEDMLDSCWIRPNQVTFGLSSWRAYRRHPKVVKAVQGNSGDEGRATRDQVAELLEVRRVIVGASRINIKKPGEDPVLNRVWGNIVAGQYIDRNADTSGGVTFGYSAVHGKKVAGTLPADMGIRGGVLVRSAESIVEKIVANRAGFLIQNVTSS
ncbi:MAG: hypothetical protein ABJO27_19140 [Pseudoruegeria sp.]